MNPSVIDTILAWRWGTSTLTFYRKRSQHPVVVVVAAVGDFYNKLHRYILLWRSMVASEAPPPPPPNSTELYSRLLYSALLLVLGLFLS